jgi:N-acetylglucosaminyldiphosphoundecaprenol N-acetyl-beta-D-mannosaminyltransferase
MDRIVIANIPVDLFTVETLHSTIASVIESKQKRIFLHANAHLIQMANTSERWLQSFFNEPDKFVMCDGSGVQLAAKLTRQTVPLKIPYNIWLWSFAKFLAAKGYSVYLLGGDEYNSRAAASKLKLANPQLKVAGYKNGYFNKQRFSKENEELLAEIRECRPDVVLVGFGMPGQERWVKENADQIAAHAIFTCGGAFDFISGKNRVAPKIFRQLYLEWLFRFLLEPIRLFERVTISNMRFFNVLAKQYILKKHSSQ